MIAQFLKNFTKVIQPFFTLGIKRTNNEIKGAILNLNKKLKNIKDIYYILTSYPDFHKTMIQIVNERTPLLLAIRQGKHKHGMKIAIYKYLNIICNLISNPQLIANGATWTSQFTLIQQRQISKRQQQDKITKNETCIQEQKNHRCADLDQNDEENVGQKDKQIEEKQQHEGSTFESQKEYQHYYNQLCQDLKIHFGIPIQQDCFTYGNKIDFDFMDFLPSEPKDLCDITSCLPQNPKHYFEQFFN